LGAKDHYTVLIAISQLDRKHWRNKNTITKALLPTIKPSLTEKSLYKRVDAALKFLKAKPNSCPDLIDFLSKLPSKIPL
jgi:hypothetical protein